MAMNLLYWQVSPSSEHFPDKTPDSGSPCEGHSFFALQLSGTQAPANFSAKHYKLEVFEETIKPFKFRVL